MAVGAVKKVHGYENDIKVFSLLGEWKNASRSSPGHISGLKCLLKEKDGKICTIKHWEWAQSV